MYKNFLNYIYIYLYIIQQLIFNYAKTITYLKIQFD